LLRLDRLEGIRQLCAIRYDYRRGGDQLGAFGGGEVGGDGGVWGGLPSCGGLKGGQEGGDFGDAVEGGLEVAAFDGVLERGVVGEDAEVDAVAQVAAFASTVGEQVVQRREATGVEGVLQVGVSP